MKVYHVGIKFVTPKGQTRERKFILMAKSEGEAIRKCEKKITYLSGNKIKGGYCMTKYKK